MSQGVNPDSLDELDRRVYDLAVQPIPLAEIAVRLGVPVPQADERLQRLYRRLGVEDRAALRALTAQPEPSPSPEPPPDPAPINEYVIGGDDYIIGAELTSDAHASPPRGSLSRRTVLAGAAVGLLGVGGALFLGSRPRGSSNENAVASGHDKDSQRTGPEVTVGPGQGEAFVTATWFPGATIDWDHGLFFLSVGGVTGFQVTQPPGLPPQWTDYRALGSGQLVAARNVSGSGLVVDRTRPDIAYAFPSGWELRAAFAEPGRGPCWLIFEGEAGGPFSFIRSESAGSVELGTLQLPAPGDRPHAVLAEPEGSRVAILTSSPGHHEVLVVHLASATVLARLPLPAPAGDGSFELESFDLTRTLDGFAATWVERPTSADGGLRQRHWRFGWSGTPESNPLEDVPGAIRSPDGASVIRTAYLETGAWPSVEIRSGGKVPLIRLRSSSLAFGDALPRQRWLADSSGFVAGVRGPGETYQFAVMSPDSFSIERLPEPPPREGESGVERGWLRGVSPSPHNPEAFAFGRTRLYVRRTGRLYEARLRTGALPAHVDPWSGRRDELVFSIEERPDEPLAGPLLIAPRIERPPFDDSFVFRVVDTGDGLNVRPEPSLKSPPLAVVQDGETLELAPDPLPQPPHGVRSMMRNSDADWLYVRTRDGVTGWVNSAYLAWA